jgi:hypothetical protein
VLEDDGDSIATSKCVGAILLRNRGGSSATFKVNIPLTTFSWPVFNLHPRGDWRDPIFDSEDETGLSTAAIVLIIVIVVCCCRKKKAQVEGVNETAPRAPPGSSAPQVRTSARQAIRNRRRQIRRSFQQMPESPSLHSRATPGRL